MGETLADLVDPERLAAERPLHRCFHAHPALGLQEADGGASAPSLHSLGLRWLVLAPDERRARQRDLLRALLERAAEAEGARFEGGWSGDLGRTAAWAARAGAVVGEDGTAVGPLTEGAIDALVAELPEVVVVDGGPDLTVVSFDGLDGLCVWMERWNAPTLEQHLQAAWWEASREREAAEDSRSLEVRRRRAVGRELRARALLLWSRLGGALVIAVIVAVEASDWEPLGEWGMFGATIVVGVALAILLDGLVTRWWERHDRA